MSDDRDIIDVEAVEIVESDNLPAVIERRASNSGGMELPNRQDTLLADNADRRCVATNSRGERCRKFAIYGATVCRTHGGATKRVKQKARIRVENAQHKLMGKLIEFAFDDAKPPDVQLRAIRDALDRGGLKPPSEVVLSQGEPKAYETVFDSIGGYPSDSYDLAGVSPAERENPSLATQPAAGCPTGEPASAGEHPPGQTTPRNHPVDARPVVDEYTDESSGCESPGQGPPRHRDRETQPQARELHITGEHAMRLANAANRAIGAMPDQLALESRHKRYPRP